LSRPALGLTEPPLQ